MHTVEALLRDSLGKLFTAAAIEIRQKGAVLYRAAFGTLDTEGDQTAEAAAVTRHTPFDFASLTKLFTASAFFRLVDAGRVNLDAPVSTVLPAFSGQRPIRPYDHPLQPGEVVHIVPETTDQVEAGAVTFRQLLTHSSGLPAWINLRNAPDIPARRAMALNTPFAYPTNSQTVYSDVGFMLLGMAIEALTDAPLDVAIKRLVSRPLELSIQYGPLNPPTSAPPTEQCAWRGRRVQGEVHDENAATLNGISGHAGLFGTATDIALLGQIYLADGGGFLSPRIAREATRLQIGDRGLGWMMRSPQGSSSGAFFGPRSFGHTGFVGNSLWADPDRQLVVALLTNNVFFGRDRMAILHFRPVFHDTVIRALEGGE